MGIRSRRAGLRSVKMKEIREIRTKPVNRFDLFQKEPLPHVVILLEESVVLHSSLLKLHVNAAAVYRNHLLDSTETSF